MRAHLAGAIYPVPTQVVHLQPILGPDGRTTHTRATLADGTTLYARRVVLGIGSTNIKRLPPFAADAAAAPAGRVMHAWDLVEAAGGSRAAAGAGEVVSGVGGGGRWAWRGKRGSGGGSSSESAGCGADGSEEDGWGRSGGLSSFGSDASSDSSRSAAFGDCDDVASDGSAEGTRRGSLERRGGPGLKGAAAAASGLRRWLGGGGAGQGQSLLAAAGLMGPGEHVVIVGGERLKPCSWQQTHPSPGAQTRPGAQPHRPRAPHPSPPVTRVPPAPPPARWPDISAPGAPGGRRRRVRGVPRDARPPQGQAGARPHARCRGCCAGWRTCKGPAGVSMCGMLLRHSFGETMRKSDRLPPPVPALKQYGAGIGAVAAQSPAPLTAVPPTRVPHHPPRHPPRHPTPSLAHPRPFPGSLTSMSSTWAACAARRWRLTAAGAAATRGWRR